MYDTVKYIVKGGIQSLFLISISTLIHPSQKSLLIKYFLKTGRSFRMENGLLQEKNHHG